VAWITWAVVPIGGELLASTAFDCVSGRRNHSGDLVDHCRRGADDGSRGVRVDGPVLFWARHDFVFSRSIRPLQDEQEF